MKIGGKEIGPLANLYGADLRKADLRGVNLYKADLRGANLDGAIFEDGWLIRPAEEDTE